MMLTFKEPNLFLKDLQTVRTLNGWGSTSSSFINNNFADNTINTRFFIETSEAWYPCEVYTVYDIPI